MFLLRLLNRTSKKEILTRSQLSIFDYKKIIDEIPLYPTDIVIDNNYYGLSYCLQKYMETKKPLNAYIEHGLILGSLVKEDAIDWCVPKIMTLSETRENHIRKKTSKVVFKIGPYIHYADDLLSEQKFQKLKQELGMTLVVFPSHSIKNIETDFNNNDLITFIKSKEVDFDAVVICLYWRDALNKDLVKSYTNKGYKITSAGHINDINFLPRLKSIIKLSDFVISNSVGTHIGYITFLEKPQMILNQIVNYKVDKNDQRAFTQRTKKNLETLEEETSEILESFHSYSYQISQQQIKTVEKYWGLSELKTKNELLEFIIN
ncbi:MAG: hypothetical protein ACI93N_000160 [Flavobacteriaceae bacterium]|jgi:hypothetical protein